MKKGSKEFIDLLGAFERTVSAFPMIRVGGLAREKMDTKHAYYQDGKTNEAFICFMQGAAYKKADMLDVVKERDALQAELAALKAAQEWRGMESAPKDGTWVLVIDSEYGDHGGAFVARYTEAFSGSWLINTSHVPHVVYPTHWMPLPTPPQEQSHE